MLSGFAQPVTLRELAGDGRISTDIRAVGAGASLRDLLAAPRAVYADDPHWVEPLYWERHSAFSEKHPLFEHLQWQAWVAFEGNRPIARISAQIDALHEDRHGDRAGYFGLFDAPDDPVLASALFATAEDWLRSRGATRAVGPFNLNINQELGLLVEGFETPPYFLMPHGRPWFEGLALGAGYRCAQEMLAYTIDPDFDAPAVMRRLIDRQGERLQVAPLDRSQLDAQISVMREIFNDAWQDNWGFVPFTAAEFRALGRELAMLLTDDAVQIASYRGEPAAFIVMLPNINEAIADLKGRLLPLGWLKLLWRLKVRHPSTSRVPLMGVRREFQNRPIGSALAMAVMDAARQGAIVRGVREVEMSWILADNQGMRKICETIGGRVSKRYRMYEKALG
ncbi:MAG: N-acetyltransferase [Pseudomonadota bacterium]